MSYPSQHISRVQSPGSPSHGAPCPLETQAQTSSGMHNVSSHQHSPPAYSQPAAFVPTHSRSTSGSGSGSNPRSASPALSIASALTSVSSHGSVSHHSQAFTLPAPSNISNNIAGRQKHKKQRLYNVDRKKICLFHKEFPHLKQEDIAKHFNVERSTVSKILKERHKWLHVPDEETMLIAKQR